MTKMKKCLHLTIFLLIIINSVNSLPPDNIVIGLFTQKYIYTDKPQPYDPSEVLTYATPTFANLGWMTGAKVVPIYSYTSQEKILAQLQKVNGVIFPGGEEWIYINTTWTKNAQFVLNYAKQQNDKGNVFPILGICQGLEVMLYLTSDKRVDFLDSIQGQNGVWNTMKFVSDQFYLLNGLSDEATEAIQDASKTKQKGVLFFYHSNGTLLQTFEKDKNLSSFWDLKGTTTSVSGQTVVSYLQAKKYPFYIMQFHPERLTQSKTYSPELFLYRSQISMKIALQFTLVCRKSLNIYPNTQLANDMIENFPMADSQRFSYRIYLFNETMENVNPNKNDKKESQTDNVGRMVVVIGVIVAVVAFGIKKKREIAANNQNRQNNDQALGQRLNGERAN